LKRNLKIQSTYVPSYHEKQQQQQQKHSVTFYPLLPLQ